jgi:hypothetical protein
VPWPTSLKPKCSPRTKSHMPSSHESTDFVQISEQMNSRKSNCWSWSHQIMKKEFLWGSWKSNMWGLLCGYKAADIEKLP